MLKLIMLTVCLSMTVGAIAQPDPDTLWTRVTGGGNIDYANALDLTDDGGFVLAGETRSFGAGGIDGYVLKYSAAGTLEWTRTVGGVPDDQAFDIQQTSDGGYILTGFSKKINSTGDAWLVKLTAAGDTSWVKYVGTSGAIERGYGVQQTDDGGYIMCGTRNSGGSQLWLVRFSSVGDTLWTRRIGGTGSEVGHDIILESDGGFVIAGYSSSAGAGAEGVYVVRTDANGDTLWTRTYGGTLTDVGYSIRPDNTGGYFVCGYTTSTGFPSGDPYLLKITGTGDTTWTRTAGVGGGPAWSVMPTAEGGCYLAGYSLAVGSTDYFLSRYTPDGVVTWTRNYGGAQQDYCLDAEQMSDGGIVMCGYSFSFSGNADIYLVKTGAEGALSLLAPNGYEEWTVLLPYTVSWFSSPPVANVRIELNRDYPDGPWEILTGSTPDDGAEVVAIGQPPSDSCRIRVTQLPVGGSDESDIDFSVRSSNGQIAFIELPDQTTPIYSWDIGVVECGTARQRALHIKNFGTDTLLVSVPLPLTTPGFSAQETCADSFYVAPGAYTSCSILPRFGDGLDGSFADTLRMRTNAANAVNDYFEFPMTVTQFSVPDEPDSVVIIGLEDSIKVVWGGIYVSSIGCALDPPVPGYVIYAARYALDPFLAIDTVTDTFYVAPATVDTIRMFRVTAIDPTP
ncbi:hypothetical protein HZB60_10435 [candidate division KSB1 bacterium]|nr:hypothetical protein [candidate division KSB1 bacterium]